MLVPYECNLSRFEDHYVNQAGNGLAYYRGQPSQKGYGIGGWFKNLFRTALPLLAKGAKSVGKEVLRTTSHIASDVLEGQNFQESAEKRAKEAGQLLAKKAINKANDMLGKGIGYKRKRRHQKRVTLTKVRKQKRRDIFDQL